MPSEAIIRLRKKLDEIQEKHKKARAPLTPAEEIRAALKKEKKAFAQPEPAHNLAPVLYKRDIPRTQAAPSKQEFPPALSVELEKTVAGEVVGTDQYGRAYLISKPADENDRGEAVASSFKDKLCDAGSPLNLCLARLAEGLDNVQPHDFVFADVESTGLSNTPLFLIGAMVWENNGFVIRQYFARDYAEEAAVIALFADLCQGKRIAVTFNGKSFDMPYIRTRAVVHGIKMNPVPNHLDLLHVCRRIWKSALPDCRLQTLEAHVCGRTRYDDIPGSQIPDTYHEYVRTTNAWRIVDILKHNELDLVTMADIMTRFPLV